MEASTVMDLKGLKCPMPTLKMTTALHKDLNQGDVLEVIADCPSFENDVKLWCKRMKKVLLWIREEGDNAKRCQVQI